MSFKSMGDFELVRNQGGANDLRTERLTTEPANRCSRQRDSRLFNSKAWGEIS